MLPMMCPTHFDATRQDLSSINVAGFVILQEVDVESQRVTVLAPNGLPMPSKTLLLGDVDFVE